MHQELASSVAEMQSPAVAVQSEFGAARSDVVDARESDIWPNKCSCYSLSFALLSAFKCPHTSESLFSPQLLHSAVSVSKTAGLMTFTFISRLKGQIVQQIFQETTVLHSGDMAWSAQESFRKSR